MNVAVVYESRTGTTQQAARLVAGGLKSAGADVSLAPIDDLDFAELANQPIFVVVERLKRLAAGLAVLQMSGQNRKRRSGQIADGKELKLLGGGAVLGSHA